MSNGDWSALDFTEVSDNKPAAGLLGLFCGSFGIHKIVLGSTKAGLLTCSECLFLRRWLEHGRSSLCPVGGSSAASAGGRAVVHLGVAYSGCTPLFREEASSQRLMTEGSSRRARSLLLMARWRVSPSATGVLLLVKR